MHPNAMLIERLYTSLDRHDDKAMAECYANDATFRDIAFDLKGRANIASMWRMIVSGDIQVTIENIDAGDREGVARIVDRYTFHETGRPVRNVIESHFRFRDARIVEHWDACDPRAWAAMALGGVPGFLAGRFRYIRRWTATKKLRTFQQLSAK